MREEDIEEIRAAGEHTPLAALFYGFMVGAPVFTIVTPNESRPAALVGVTPTKINGAGLVWLLGTRDIEKYPITFLRHSKEVLKYFFTKYEVLYNSVYKHNYLHIKWLEWLGFNFFNTTKEEMFHMFIKTKEEVRENV